MSFQLNPLPPRDDPDRQEMDERCRQTRRDFGRLEYVTYVLMGALVAGIVVALLRVIMR